MMAVWLTNSTSKFFFCFCLKLFSELLAARQQEHNNAFQHPIQPQGSEFFASMGTTGSGHPSIQECKLLLSGHSSPSPDFQTGPPAGRLPHQVMNSTMSLQHRRRLQPPRMLPVEETCSQSRPPLVLGLLLLLRQPAMGQLDHWARGRVFGVGSAIHLD